MPPPQRIGIFERGLLQDLLLLGVQFVEPSRGLFRLCKGLHSVCQLAYRCSPCRIYRTLCRILDRNLYRLVYQQLFRIRSRTARASSASLVLSSVVPVPIFFDLFPRQLVTPPVKLEALLGRVVPRAKARRAVYVFVWKLLWL